MPSNETPIFAVIFGIGFIILSILMFTATYNAHISNPNWINETSWIKDYFGDFISSIFSINWFDHYFGGFVCFIFFGVMGTIFTCCGIYFINKNSS
jgi:hypothetical protein